MPRNFSFIITTALACLCALPEARAGEKAMKLVLDQWQQQQAEYEAALSLATTEEQRASIPPPSAADLASALWKTVRAQTGTREVLQSAVSPRAAGDEKAGTQKVYEYEQEWAAPAVIWFISHPEAFTTLFGHDAKLLSAQVRAMLNAVYRVHYMHPLIGQICPVLAESTSPQAHAIAEKIFEHNPDPAARASAALTLSIMLSNPALAESEGGHARARSKRVYYLRQALNLAPREAKFGTASLTQVADEQVYQLRHLSLGTIPPRITVSSPEQKQATFPVIGKPNLIFFWSPAEDVGFSIMSKQKSLKSTYPDLELCPIVPHGDVDEWLRMLQENGIDTCYMDNEKGEAGTSYRVRQLPYVVLTNERANILYAGYPDMQLQAALQSYFSAPRPAAPQPAAPPQPRGTEEPPALRPMPAF